MSIKNREMVAKVIIGISTNALNRLFTYVIPTDLNDQVEIGSVVLVPFGKGNHLKEAYVIDIEFNEGTYEFELKKIYEVKENVSVMKELLQVASWMHNRYQCTITSALKLMLPRDINVKLKTFKTIVINKVQLTKLKEYKLMIIKDKRLVKRLAIIEFLENVCINSDTEIYYFVEKDLLAWLNTNSAMIKNLEKLDLLERRDEVYERKIAILDQKTYDEKFELTKEQLVVSNEITKSLDTNKIFLVHGVTGSGKTEVYMNLIKRVISNGQKAIVLIPEIGLTPQMIMRFTGRFGNIIGVMHSKLNLGERYEQWQKASNNDVKIMIGARSAIFTPFDNIGIIIIDEEHEHTYKSEQNPKYHAREVAIKRGIYHNCPVVLGSATPLVDNYYKASLNQYKLLNMTKRAVANAYKDIHLIDMRQELEAGNTGVLSRELYNAISEALLKGEQIILFINRRGYANSISCRQCGFVYKCDHCDISMTYHKSNRRLICHMCGDSKPMKKECPMCGSKYIKGFGAGTQKIEALISTIFKNAKIIRMDQDTTSRKHGHETILKQFRNHEADILIGTQMVAKGHDFHNVTVVGVLAADISLNVEDYRGAERTFQLITQVIGRTGRGDRPGRAFIQTYQPGHYSIVHAINEDYISFYNEEIIFRQTMIYPPFCHLLCIITMSENDYLGRNLLDQCVSVIKNLYLNTEDTKFIILGPAKTSIGKIKGLYRNRIIVKGSSYKKLTLVMKELYNRKDKDNNYTKVKLSMELNPMGFN